MLYIGGEFFIKEKDLIIILNPNTAKPPLTDKTVTIEQENTRSIFLTEKDNRTTAYYSPVKPKTTSKLKIQEVHDV